MYDLDLDMGDKLFFSEKLSSTELENDVNPNTLSKRQHEK
jgi:hypothetical protein